MNYRHPKGSSDLTSLSKGDVTTIDGMYFGPTKGGNRGERLRRDKPQLTACVKGFGREGRVERCCRGRTYVCGKGAVLRACVEANGGLACLGEPTGQCRG